MGSDTHRFEYISINSTNKVEYISPGMHQIYSLQKIMQLVILQSITNMITEK